MTIAEFRCPHGFGPAFRGYPGLMMAPFSTCACCGTTYYYIDTGSWGLMGGHGRSHTPNLCDDCGGTYVEWTTGPLSGSTETPE